MNAKENWLKLIKDDGALWIGKPWEAFKGNIFDNIFVSDPISAAIGSTRVFDRPYMDSWGVTWMMHTGDPGATPYITSENKALKDLSTWKDVVSFPTLDGHDWKPFEDFVSAIDRDRNLVMSFVPGGLFERSHYLMGFEDALCAYMDDPDTMRELVGAIADWKIGQIEQILKHLRPDVIHFHDDWGDKSNVFLPPAIWREVIKPHHKRIVDCVKAGGALFMHHSDSVCGPIVEDMAEIGIDIWQGVIPQDDIAGIQKKLGGRMALIGGIDAQIIDMPEADEAVIRSEVRRCIDDYCLRGAFVPCIPNITPIFPEVKRIYEDELVKYGKDFFARRTR
ncbi:MAG: uroporphyrinogen decarboxylase family protein [Treponemataceae bacterium]